MSYIETDRLILRSWKLADLPLFIEMNKDARVMRYFPSILTAEQRNHFTIEFNQSLSGMDGDCMPWN